MEAPLGTVYYHPFLLCFIVISIIEDYDYRLLGLGASPPQIRSTVS